MSETEWQEFGVQRVHPPRHLNYDVGPYGHITVFATREQAVGHTHGYRSDTFRILVRDVSEWRES